MTQGNSEKKHTVLCVDDEENILKALIRVLRKENYTLLTARSGEEGLDIINNNTVHLVLSDHRMPGMTGIDLFAQIKEKHPDTIRIILSGYTEIGAITASVNEGHIYKFFLKPWNDENLKMEITKALEQYDLIQDNKALTKTIIKQNKDLVIANETLEKKVKERTRNLELKNQALELSQAVFEELPYPVLCIGSDLLIVLINRKVREIAEDAHDGIIGEEASDYLSEELTTKISDVVETGKGALVKKQKVFNTEKDVYVSPMSGRFQGQGVIVSVLSELLDRI